MLYNQLPTEKRNAESMRLDEMSTLEAAKLMNRMDREIPDAVERALPEIVKTVEMAVSSFQQGGRMIYCGAGTSGRLGVLDASECLPTFGVSENMIMGKIAGGDIALRTAVEGAEDDFGLGEKEMENLGICGNDLIIAISASGSAAYCLGALTHAKKQGARTAGICCVESPAFGDVCDCLIRVVVGPEILTGSTRLRAGTATKMVLNIISTLSMKEMGKIYQNLMVDVIPTNKKLMDRAIRIVMSACNVNKETAKLLMEECGNEIKTAIVYHETGTCPSTARTALKENDGFVRQAILKLNES